MKFIQTGEGLGKKKHFSKVANSPTLYVKNAGRCLQHISWTTDVAEVLPIEQQPVCPMPAAVGLHTSQWSRVGAGL